MSVGDVTLSLMDTAQPTEDAQPLPLPIDDPDRLEASAAHHELVAEGYQEVADASRERARRLRMLASALRLLEAQPAAAVAATRLALGWTGTTDELVAAALQDVGDDTTAANAGLFAAVCPEFVPLADNPTAIAVALRLLKAGWAGSHAELAAVALGIATTGGSRQ